MSWRHLFKKGAKGMFSEVHCHFQRKLPPEGIFSGHFFHFQKVFGRFLGSKAGSSHERLHAAPSETQVRQLVLRRFLIPLFSKEGDLLRSTLAS